VAQPTTTVARPAQAGVARSGQSPRPESMRRRDWWRLTGALVGRRWLAQVRGITEHASCKERGDGSHRGGGATAARWVFGSDDASLWPTVTRLGSWGPERERERAR
jgi:hypothetical protein